MKERILEVIEELLNSDRIKIPQMPITLPLPLLKQLLSNTLNDLSEEDLTKFIDVLEGLIVYVKTGRNPNDKNNDISL